MEKQDVDLDGNRSLEWSQIWFPIGDLTSVFGNEYMGSPLTLVSVITQDTVAIPHDRIGLKY